MIPRKSARQSERTPPRPASLHFDALAAVTLCAAIFFVYRNTLDNPIFGDSIYTLKTEILANKIRELNLFALRWIPFNTFNWIYEFFGKDWYWQNLFNVLLHAATAVSFYFFFKSLFTAVKPGGDASSEFPSPRANALIAAAFFGFAPIAAYATAYLAQRSILLAILFSALSLTSFLKGLIGGKSRFYALSCLFYFAAVHSKEHVVMLPALLPMLAFLVRRPRGKEWISIGKEITPLLLIDAVIALHVTWLLSAGTLLRAYEPNAGVILRSATAVGQGPEGNLAVLNALAQGTLFFRYLFHSFVPWTGSMSIDVLVPFPTSYWDWPFPAGFILYLMFPLAGLALLRRGSAAGLVGFALLAPWFLFWTEFAAVRVSEQFVLYRAYAWTPWLYACVPAFMQILRRFFDGANKTVYAISLAALIMTASATAGITPTFDTASAVWADAAAKIGELGPVAHKAHRIYYFLGQSLFYENDMDGALAAYQRAVALRPEISEAWQNIGYAYVRKRDYVSARRAYEMQLRYHPGSAEAHLNLGNIALLTNDHTTAEDEFLKSLDSDPSFAKARYNLGLLRSGDGRDDEALADFDATVRMDASGPLAADSHYEAGMIRLKKGDVGGAVKRFREALAIRSDHEKTLRVKKRMERDLGRILF